MVHAPSNTGLHELYEDENDEVAKLLDAIRRKSDGLEGEIFGLYDDLKAEIVDSAINGVQDTRSALLFLFAGIAGYEQKIADKVNAWADKKQIPKGHLLRDDVIGYLRSRLMCNVISRIFENDPIEPLRDTDEDSVSLDTH
ncbi:hypothetical protein KJ742_04015 [Patescibacteria group bacterium]|nr:hypothetical protein [Patescibacteria group bacterium]MBU1683087.1 hypothetical protein [Patescibacteria group bacterium]MBU1935152.1 hypothetical protein [Patescibacteria group bacterium]